MARDKPVLPLHVTLLGEALGSLPARIDAAVSAPTRPEEAETDFLNATRFGLQSFDHGIRRVVAEANVLGGIVAGADAPATDVYRAAGRMEAILDGMLGIYANLYHLRVDRSLRRGRKLLLAAYRHLLGQIRDWLDDIVETVADPVSAVKKRGLPTSGKVELRLFLTVEAPDELRAFSDWLADMAAYPAMPSAGGVGPGSRAGRRGEESDGWGTLATLTAGILLGGLFFGDDE